jgi:hypothetical protein
MLFTDETRINKIYFHYPSSEIDQLRIEIPDGFAAEQLPDDVNIDLGAMSYHAKYARDGHFITYERALIINGIIFDVDEYQTLKSFFERVHQADQAVVSLKRG